MTFEINGRSFSFFADAQQWEKFFIILHRYFLHPVVVAAFLFLLGWLCLYLYAKHRHEDSLLKKARKVAPLVYLFFMASISLFNRAPGVREPFHFRLDFVFAGTDAYHESRVLFALFDFLYYIPYGALLKWSRPDRKTDRLILTVLLTGLCTELLQYLFACGIGTVEHWILYSLGGGLGLVLAAYGKRLTAPF